MSATSAQHFRSCAQRRSVGFAATRFYPPGWSGSRSRRLVGSRPQTFIELEKVSAWLLGVNAARINEAMRALPIHFQTYLVRELHAAFNRLTGLPGQSRAVQDLDELGRVDTALTVPAERQTEIEQSQDRAWQA